MNQENLKALFQDIDERAAVAFLKFCRDTEPKAPSDIGTDLVRIGFLAGFKVAMHEAVRIRLGMK